MSPAAFDIYQQIGWKQYIFGEDDVGPLWDGAPFDDDWRNSNLPPRNKIELRKRTDIVNVDIDQFCRRGSNNGSTVPTASLRKWARWAKLQEIAMQKAAALPVAWG